MPSNPTSLVSSAAARGTWPQPRAFSQTGCARAQAVVQQRPPRGLFSSEMYQRAHIVFAPSRRCECKDL